MAIDVQVPTVLRKHTGGQKVVEGEGSTLLELIEDIGRRHANLRSALIDEDGTLHRYVNIYVNDEDARYLGGASAPLDDGDTVSILPAVAGGA